MPQWLLFAAAAAGLSRAEKRSTRPLERRAESSLENVSQIYEQTIVKPITYKFAVRRKRETRTSCIDLLKVALSVEMNRHTSQKGCDNNNPERDQYVQDRYSSHNIVHPHGALVGD
jgi:hypothetical protein